jgi:hypothetical protein
VTQEPRIPEWNGEDEMGLQKPQSFTLLLRVPWLFGFPCRRNASTFLQPEATANWRLPGNASGDTVAYEMEMPTTDFPNQAIRQWKSGSPFSVARGYCLEGTDHGYIDA